MKYYAVIDTNVLVSAMIKWNSIPGNVLELTFSGTIIPLLNDQIMKEYKEILHRPKFCFTDKIINTVVDEIERLGIYVNAEKLDLILPGPKDFVFYEVVMEERKIENAYLITGNIKHFPNKPYVVTPKQMIDIIIENSEN